MSRDTGNHMHDLTPSQRPVAGYTRLGWLVVLLGVGGFLLWASIAPLDKGVPVSGTVISDGNRKSVQHPTGGIVDQMLVKEGDTVTEGQLVARLNTTQATANLNASRETVLGLQMQIRGLRASRESKVLQARLLGQQIGGLDDLVRDGFVPRNRLLELQRQAAQLQGGMAEDEGNLGRAERQINEIQQRLVAYEFEIANAAVKTTAAGVVQGLTVFNPGAVIGPGHKLFEIVPQGVALVVEGQVPTHLIDRVAPGLGVELMFTAFNQASTPHIPAHVTLVSPDRFVDERSGTPYFKLKAEVTPEGMAMLTGLSLRPGMPVELFIKTGERTLMNYLFKPLLDRFHGGLREN
ncbi:HlyD family efflux transporter periplasmic adaptor subunit [Polaromonas sp. JS666]|uniref:HlyD family efflux transporter periplasmic adaptor subunit n=1 Tax=Polaromonas sp. (strain JS666 / ATCC BAA-500) TaxID=296591 RepID=UPI000046437C|nr:HlyD family efflux transporter periplasmic adaptor subunit [Polaromonas sp. JS666]ABE46801.1 secretion protein HlyD [Polaromonas sp. JS666]